MLTFDDAGHGPAVLLLHSSVADRRMWRGQFDAIAADHRVIAPDLPGHGESALSPGPLSLADELVGLLDALDVDRATVVGSSFGGAVALRLAHAAPRRVAGLVLLCTAYEGVEPTEDVQEFGAEETRLLEAGDVRGAVELNVRTWLGPDADDEARDLVRVMQRRAFEIQLAADTLPDPPYLTDEAPDLAALDLPVRIAYGRHDLDMFADIAAHLTAGISGARSVELDWAAHLPALERPAQTAELLRRFIAEIERS